MIDKRMKVNTENMYESGLIKKCLGTGRNEIEKKKAQIDQMREKWM